MVQYKYKLRSDFTFSFQKYLSHQEWQAYLKGKPERHIRWADNDGSVWLILDTETKEFTIPKGYAWDGCSPKIFIGDWLCIGTPDGNPFRHTGLPKTYVASLCHDPLYQFRDRLSQEGYRLPGTRKMYDLVFRDELRKTKFSMTWFYYLCVRFFGGLYAGVAKFFRPHR